MLLGLYGAQIGIHSIYCRIVIGNVHSRSIRYLVYIFRDFLHPSVPCAQHAAVSDGLIGAAPVGAVTEGCDVWHIGYVRVGPEAPSLPPTTTSFGDLSTTTLAQHVRLQSCLHPRSPSIAPLAAGRTATPLIPGMEGEGEHLPFGYTHRQKVSAW
jgi:hypothetical protein